MDWYSLGDHSLSSGRLIQSTNFQIIAGEVEFRNGAYHLYEDQAMSIQLEDSDLFVRSIFPESDILYDIDVDKTVVLEGSMLGGDQKGRLSIGVYNKYLEYPLRVIDIQLSAPFHIRGKVSVSEDAVSLRPLDISNMPENESNSYPYTFQYNLSNSLSEDDWKDFSDPIKDRYFEFKSFYDIPIRNTMIWNEYNYKGSPVRIRLRSALGKLYYLRLYVSVQRLFVFLAKSQ